MKHLIIALAAAVAVTTAFARITVQQGFEDDMVGFVSSDSQEDASTNVTYAAESMAKPSDSLAPYPFSEFGDGFLSLDTGDATLWRTNTVKGNVYLDMVMQFNPCTAAPALGSEGTKIAVYLNSDSNLVVMAGTSASDRTPHNYVTTSKLDPGTWGRLTISATVVDGSLAFGIRLNGYALTAGATSEFPCLTDDTTVNEVGFSGTGALDDFVARTTDPFIQNPAVRIGEFGWASIQDAIDDAGASSVIELLDDNADAVTLGEGESLKLKKNGYTYTGRVRLPWGYAVSIGDEDAQGVTTYSQVDGVAAINVLDSLSDNTPDYEWYATFSDAYTEAYKTFKGQEGRTAKWSDLYVRVDSDFNPGDVSEGMKFRNVEFEATTEDSVDISLGGKFYAVGSYKFSDTATLTLWKNQAFSTSSNPSSDIATISGGTLEIPAGVILTMNSYLALDSIVGVSGQGTICPTTAAANYLINPSRTVALRTMLANANWKGTLELSGSYSGEFDPNLYANAESTLRFNGITIGRLGSDYSTYSMGIELVGNGLTYAGGDYSRVYTFSGAIKGTGSLSVGASQNRSLYLYFNGDVSGFTGNIFATNGNERVVFGHSTTGGGGSITVWSDLSVTNASTALWKANDIVLRGELVANGTIDVSGKLWGNTGTAVYRANNASAALTTAPSWNGKYVVGWNPEGGDFDIGMCYGVSGADSKLGTIQIDGQGGAFEACLVGNMATTTNKADIVINAVTELSTLGGTNFMFTGSVSGSGALSIPSTQTSSMYLYLAGDTSGYTGDIAVSGSEARLVFGDSEALYAKSITVATGAIVTNAASKTWSAAQIEVNGELVANGTITTSGSLYGTGVYQANNSAAAIAVAPSWNGTYNANFDSGDASWAFDIPVGASATTVINGANGSFSGYPKTVSNGSGVAPNVGGTIVLNANWTVGNGWGDKETTFASLSGSGNLTVNGAAGGSTKIHYIITKLDGYTGTLGGNRGKFTIGTVNVAAAPLAMTNIVKTVKGTYGQIVNAIVPYTVNNGEGSEDQKLVYCASGMSDGEGYYLAVAKVGDSGYYAKLADAVTAATKAGASSFAKLADTDEVIPADWKYDSASGNYVAKVYVAQVGDTKCESLKGAVDAATDGQTVTLLRDLTIDTRIALSKSLTLNLGGHTITRTADPNNDNGSAFRVDGSYAVVITNGTIDCSQVDDSTVVDDGVYAIDVKNGGSLTLDSLTIAVDSQAGACVYPWAGSSVTINGGKYRNDTADDYQHHAGWRGMAVNQANVAAQLITINGGSFKQEDPKNGDDAGLCTTFLAPGKTTRLNGSTCYWDVVDEYTITLDANGGSVDSATVKYAAGDAAFDLPIPTLASNTFLGWTNETIVVAFTNFVPGTTAAAGDLALYAKWEPESSDDWNTPSVDTPEAVKDSLVADGFDESVTNYVASIAEFNAFVEYVKTATGAATPEELKAGAVANAPLCYALRSTTIPETEITDADVTIDSVEKTGSAGGVAVTVSIDGVSAGASVPSEVLAKVVTAKGGTSVTDMSAANVDVSGHGTADGKVCITVTPKSASNAFFTQVIVNK